MPRPRASRRWARHDHRRAVGRARRRSDRAAPGSARGVRRSRSRHRRCVSGQLRRPLRELPGVAARCHGAPRARRGLGRGRCGRHHPRHGLDRRRRAPPLRGGAARRDRLPAARGRALRSWTRDRRGAHAPGDRACGGARLAPRRHEQRTADDRRPRALRQDGLPPADRAGGPHRGRARALDRPAGLRTRHRPGAGPGPRCRARAAAAGERGAHPGPDPHRQRQHRHRRDDRRR